MKKKELSIMLVIMIMMIAISGCSSNKNSTSGITDSSSSSGTSEVTSTKDSKITNAKDADFKFNGYPMDAKDVTLKWYVGGSGMSLNPAFSSYKESPFHMNLMDQVGVTIEWQFPTAGTDPDQAFNLMLASGDLPDIIYYSIIKDVERLIDIGIVRDLTNYIQEYSPAYYKFLKSKEIYDKYMKTDSGKYFGYGFFREDGGWNDTYLGPVIRQDWLDELGLETPKTISDWDNILRKFKEKYGAMLSFPWYRFETTGISGAFGAYGATKCQFYIDANKKVQLAQAQPEWKNYMAKLNEWWEEGLLDHDVLTMDAAAAKTKALNGVIGISIISMGQLTTWRDDAEKAGNGANWVGLPYPTGDDGTLSMVFGGSGIGSAAAVITTSCTDEKLEIAMRLLDYGYTEEGFLFWNFGKKGESWEYDENNEPAFTELVTKDPDGINNAVSKYSGTVWSCPGIQATKLLYLKNSEEAVKANDLWYYPNKHVTENWQFPSAATFRTEEVEEIEGILSSISTYVSEMAVRFMIGEESLDKFDSFVAQLDKMGLQKVLDVYQKVYDRFLAR